MSNETSARQQAHLASVDLHEFWSRWDYSIYWRGYTKNQFALCIFTVMEYTFEK